MEMKVMLSPRIKILFASLFVFGIIGLTSLTIPQASAAFTGTCTPPPSSMVAWLPGDGDANDISGNNNNGTLVNGTKFTPGMVGLGFSFDGVDDFVRIPNSPSLDITGNAITIDAWIM